jgi:hypothetical protein
MYIYSFEYNTRQYIIIQRKIQYGVDNNMELLLFSLLMIICYSISLYSHLKNNYILF